MGLVPIGPRHRWAPLDAVDNNGAVAVSCKRALSKVTFAFAIARFEQVFRYCLTKRGQEYFLLSPVDIEEVGVSQVYDVGCEREAPRVREEDYGLGEGVGQTHLHSCDAMRPVKIIDIRNSFSYII